MEKEGHKATHEYRVARIATATHSAFNQSSNSAAVAAPVDMAAIVRYKCAFFRARPRALAMDCEIVHHVRTHAHAGWPSVSIYIRFCALCTMHLLWSPCQAQICPKSHACWIRIWPRVNPERAVSRNCVRMKQKLGDNTSFR